jgi:folate-binding protein YgfZ
MMNQTQPLVDGAGLLLRPTAGLLMLTGVDRADFLQRMTTNNIAILRPGQAAVTVLTSPTARILQVFTVLCRSDDLLLLPAPGEAHALNKELRGKIFFMDKVEVVNRSEAYVTMRLVGPKAQRVLVTAALPAPAADDHWVAQEDLHVLLQLKYEAPGYLLLVPTERAEFVRRSLVDGGATPVDDAAYAAHLVRLGRPAAGAELTPDYSPLEAGLAWACADNKGCYTGQEIIARQQTYDKVTRTLVQLRSSAPLAPGQPLSADGRDAGVITSVAAADDGSTIALAIVKRPHNQPGAHLMAGDGEVVVMAARDEVHKIDD